MLSVPVPVGDIEIVEELLTEIEGVGEAVGVPDIVEVPVEHAVIVLVTVPVPVAVALKLLDQLDEWLPDADMDNVGEGVNEGDGVGVAVGVAVSVPEALCVAGGVADSAVADALGDAPRESVAVGEMDLEGVAHEEGEEERDAVVDEVGVSEPVPVPLTVGAGVSAEDVVGVMVGERRNVLVPDCVGESVGVAELVGVEVPLPVGKMLGEVEGEANSDSEAELLAVRVRLLEGVDEPVPVPVDELVAVELKDAALVPDTEGATVPLGLIVAEGVPLPEGVGVIVEEAVGSAEGVPAGDEDSEGGAEGEMEGEAPKEREEVGDVL